MHVVATAGHVDHGKSTLVRALTGMEPDRWAEERRRGLTIGLGFAWTDLPGGHRLAMVDVPGHERFVPTMLAGVGPVPAVLFVVAADEGWMPQSAEHLAAVDALGVRHGLLAVTRSDLADPAPARDRALRELAGSSLGVVPAVVVSGRTGAGMSLLRTELERLAASLPAPDVDADVRLWVDRSFTITGAGAVATGTLAAGTLSVGDELVQASTGRRLRVRGLQSAAEQVPAVAAVARVAVNLRGVAAASLVAGDALLRADAWLATDLVDVAVRGPGVDRLPAELMLHIGSAAVPVRARTLGSGSGSGSGGLGSAGLGVARLRLARPLPLRVGDRVLLRDPGRHQVVCGADVLDVRPPQPRRRGWAREHGDRLAALVIAPHERDTSLVGAEQKQTDVAFMRDSPAAPSPAADSSAEPSPAALTPAALTPAVLTAAALTALAWEQLRRRRFVPEAEQRASGLPVVGERLGAWRADPAALAEAAAALPGLVDQWSVTKPLEAGMPLDAAAQRLELPDAALLRDLAVGAGLSIVDGRVGRAEARGRLPAAVESAVGRLVAELAEHPFRAPEAARLKELGLGRRELGAAVRAGRLLSVIDGVVLAAGADRAAAAVLTDLPQPFTVSAARQAWDTTRRVAVPLLELLDRQGVTDSLPDGTRRLRP